MTIVGSRHNNTGIIKCPSWLYKGPVVPRGTMKAARPRLRSRGRAFCPGKSLAGGGSRETRQITTLLCRRSNLSDLKGPDRGRSFTVTPAQMLREPWWSRHHPPACCFSANVALNALIASLLYNQSSSLVSAGATICRQPSRHRGPIPRFRGVRVSPPFPSTANVGRGGNGASPVWSRHVSSRYMYLPISTLWY
jgi:hypothetical protein